MPLAWAHAEYIQLVRSAADGCVFGVIPEIAKRYRNRRRAKSLEIWRIQPSGALDTRRGNPASPSGFRVPIALVLQWMEASP